MAAEIITKEDLEHFRKLLIADIKELFGDKIQTDNSKWLKSYQVKNMLRISPGTLQNLRINGSLPFTKIGGIIYYKKEDVQKLLSGS
jgi:hypothetical protein